MNSRVFPPPGLAVCVAVCLAALPLVTAGDARGAEPDARASEAAAGPLPAPQLKPVPELVPPLARPPGEAPGKPVAGTKTADAGSRNAAQVRSYRRGWRIDLRARRRNRRHVGKIRRGERQGGTAHPQRNGARGLAALRRRARRDLGKGQRAVAQGPRLDHRPGAALPARYGNRILHLAALLHRRERKPWRRRRDQVRRPRPIRSARRPLHDLCRAERGLVHPDRPARNRQDADARHRPRRDRAFPGGADRVHAVDRIPALQRAQERLPDAHTRVERAARLRCVGAVLPQPRAQLRRDADAAGDDQARGPARHAVPLYLREFSRAESRRTTCRTIASPAPTATRCRGSTSRIWATSFPACRRR